MKIVINDQRRIYSVQRDFNRMFPNLRIEFYAKPPNQNASHPKTIIEDTSTTLADCRTSHKNGEVTVSPGMTIAELEQHLHDIFGIGVEILKNEDGMWNKPEQIGHLSLKEQNNNSFTH